MKAQKGKRQTNSILKQEKTKRSMNFFNSLKDNNTLILKVLLIYTHFGLISSL